VDCIQLAQCRFGNELMFQKEWRISFLQESDSLSLLKRAIVGYLASLLVS
jgi:hypothetical protein